MYKVLGDMGIIGRDGGVVGTRVMGEKGERQ